MLRQLAINILRRIEETNAYADIIINNEFKKSNLTDRNKRFVTELVNGTLRWRGQLDWIIKQFYVGEFKKCPSPIKYILEVTLYQLIHLDKIPDYAAISESVLLAKKVAREYWANKVNAILRNFLRKKGQLNYPDIYTNPAEHVAVKYSHPMWMIERWIHRYGINETIKLCEANNKSPKMSLRVNQTKTSVQQFKNILSNTKIDVTNSLYLTEFLKVKNLPDLSKYQPFQEGLFSVQDESAGLVAHLIAPQPGEIIIDLCAAPGGKTTHLAELANAKCLIFAVDLYFSKLSLIHQNVQRLNLSNVHLINADGIKFAGRKVDKVLVDAPCSGLGVLSKRSDLRWKRSLDQIRQMTQVQYQILNNAASLLKKKGVIVYSTCTIEPEENEEIIVTFLNNNPDFLIDDPARYINKNLVLENKYVYTYPHINKIDGSFAVRLIKR